MSEFNPLDAMRNNSIGTAIAIASATFVAATASAESKIINETSSITPITGAPTGEPVPPNPGGAPDILSPLHTSLQPGEVNYQIQIPNLNGDASVSIVNRSNLLTLKKVGNQTISPQQAKSSKPWSLTGNSTSTGSTNLTENLNFKLSSRAHLGEKICTTMLIRETNQNPGWTRENDYTDQECTTVGEPLPNKIIAQEILRNFIQTWQYFMIKINPVKEILGRGPRDLEIDGICNAPDITVRSITETASKLVLNNCAGDIQRIPFNQLTTEQQKFTYFKIKNKIGSQVGNSLGYANSINWSTNKVSWSLNDGSTIQYNKNKSDGISKIKLNSNKVTIN